MKVWEREPVRGDVLDDYERSTSLDIQGSPQIFCHDGTANHNQGMDVERERLLLAKLG